MVCVPCIVSAIGPLSPIGSHQCHWELDVPCAGCWVYPLPALGSVAVWRVVVCRAGRLARPLPRMTRPPRVRRLAGQNQAGLLSHASACSCPSRLNSLSFDQRRQQHVAPAVKDCAWERPVRAVALREPRRPVWLPGPNLQVCHVRTGLEDAKERPGTGAGPVLGGHLEELADERIAPVADAHHLRVRLVLAWSASRFRGVTWINATWSIKVLW